MKKEIKKQIDELRNQGFTYGEIASKLGISRSSVSSYCSRNKTTCDVITSKCLECGVSIRVLKGHKHRKFCSDKCRNKYWLKHRSEVNRKTYHTKICPYCKKEFSKYGKPHQIYCSLACYIKDRYGVDINAK